MGIKLAETVVVLLVSVKAGKVLSSRSNLDQSNLGVWRTEAIALKVYKVMLSQSGWETLELRK